jgi:putative salt-induced outer membrane protein YdiY
MRILRAFVVVVLASPIVAMAQDPPPGPRRTQLTLDFGFVNAAGNSDVTSLNLGEKLTWRPGRVVLSQTAKALYGETEGTTTTESYEAGARAEYPVSSRIGAFALVVYQRDPFAGVAMRLGGGPGVSIGLLRSARDTLSVETALTMQKERSTADVEQSFGATRTAAIFKHMFTATAFVTQTLEWTANLETMDDQRLNSETALTAPLSRQIALRVAYLIRHDNLPEPGFEKTDRILTTGVQISL